MKPLMLLLHGFGLIFGYFMYIHIMSQLKVVQYSGKNMGFETEEASGSKLESAMYSLCDLRHVT